MDAIGRDLDGADGERGAALARPFQVARAEDGNDPGALGMTGRMAERVAAGMDPEMGRAVLKLLRSARQPAMAEAGRLLPSAAQRPGLALIAVDDFERASGTLVQHEWAARQSGARMAHLEGVGHWWPEETPAPVAEALTNFWAELPDPERAPATDSKR
jgi:pimeloyl-ACP methyl ester carboxylesterase